MTNSIVDFGAVTFVRGERQILGPIELSIGHGENWLVIGPNGCGKSTLMRMAALQEHPTSGTLTVLGGELGRIDVRTLRRRIGFGALGLADRLRPDLRAVDVVVTALNAALEPWWHHYSDVDIDIARARLDSLGVGDRWESAFGTLSSGERQRVLLARSLMADPELIILDEPYSGLDLGAREDLVYALGDLMTTRKTGALLLVTHHLEEVPVGISHLLAMRDGEAMYSGSLEAGLTDDILSRTFGLPLHVERSEDGRISARLLRSDGH